MRQNPWAAAIRDLEADGLATTPCPSNFPQDRERLDVSYQFMSFSEGTESAQGRWASGPSPDGKGQLSYVETPRAMGDIPELGPVDPRLYVTPKMPVPPVSS